LKITKYVFIPLVIAAMLSVSGCAEIAMRHLMMNSDGTYSELKPFLRLPQPGTGRLFVYAAKGGPTILDPMGAVEICMVDGREYKIMGGTYWYIDLPAGYHTVSADYANGKHKSGCGKHPATVSVLLQDKTAEYCRISVEDNCLVELEKVDPDAAEEELAGLEHLKTFETVDDVKLRQALPNK